MLLLDSVRVPVPVLVRPPIAAGFVPVPSLITPPNTVLALFPPTVRVVAAEVVVLPKTTLLVPPPWLAREAIAGAALVKFTVAVPLLGFIRRPALPAVLLPNDALLVAFRVPALTVVSPV